MMEKIAITMAVTGTAVLLLMFILALFNKLRQNMALYAIPSALAWLSLAYYAFTLKLWIFTALSLVLSMLTLADMFKKGEAD